MRRPVRHGLHRPRAARILYGDLRPEAVAPEQLCEVVQTVGLAVEKDGAVALDCEDIVQELALRGQQCGIHGPAAAHQFDVVREQTLQKAVDVLARKRQNAPVRQGDAGGGHGAFVAFPAPLRKG